MYRLFNILLALVLLSYAECKGNKQLVNDDNFDSCLNGYIKHDEACYKLHNDPKSWQEAEEICVRDNAHLVNIYSEEENNFVSTQCKGSFPVWIGLQNDNNIGEFRWSNMMRGKYMNWGTTFENGNQSTCAAIQDGGQWATFECSESKYKFMCKYLDSRSVCPGSNWIVWNGNCYYYSSSVYHTWDSALNVCRSFSSETWESDLVSILSYSENQFVDNLIYYSSWIGLNSSSYMNYWTDGHAVNYTYWASGEPDYPGSYCSMIDPNYYGYWYDDLCYNNKYLICKAHNKTVDKPTPPREGPQYKIVIMDTFQSDTGANFSNDCMMDYADEMNQKTASVSQYVNELLGNNLCSWLYPDDIKIVTASSPMSFHGNKGETFPTFYLSASGNLRILDVEMCGNYTASFLLSHSNWGEPILPHLPGCPGVVFNDSMFHYYEEEWICNSQKSVYVGAKSTALLYGIKHTGLFHTRNGEILENNCLNEYNSEFNSKTYDMITDTNTRLDNGQICGKNGMKISSGSATLHSNGNRGASSQTYILQPPSDWLFADVYDCSDDISAYLGSHNNWVQPIIPQIPGCPALDFDPTEFSEDSNYWICN